MPTRDEIDTKERAERALRAGKPQDALELYHALTGKVAVFELGLYESWMEGLMAAHRALGRRSEAAFVCMGLARYADAERLLDRKKHPVPWALCVSRQGRGEEAATHLWENGFPMLAAGEFRAAGNLDAALAMWERVLVTQQVRTRPYESALVHCVLSELEGKRKNTVAAREHAATAVQKLESLADDFESRGLRERAFDCYTLILRLGQEQGTFENVAEGYSNAIRILMADHQRYVPLQYTDDFIADAAERGEFQAAAVAALDAAEHSRRLGLAFEKQYLARASGLWSRAAEHALKSGFAIEMAENALSAALDAAASMGDLPLVGRIYQKMAGLEVAPERVERYRQLAHRYLRAGESPTVGGPLPDHLRIPNPYPDIGWQDLVEWELHGRAIETLSVVLVERGDHIRFRRLALRALLVAAARERGDSTRGPADNVSPETKGDPPGIEQDVALALALGNVQIYEVLTPLEELFHHKEPLVRAAVMNGVGQILNKRSFGLVEKGLADPDEIVRQEARRALRGLRFRDGLDPLVRIFQSAREQSVKETALAAIADIGSIEAGLFLISVVREEAEPMRALAIDRLTSYSAPEVVQHLRAAVEGSTGEVLESLRTIVRAIESTPVV